MISCKEYVSRQKQQLKTVVGSLKKVPKLCVVQIGCDDASDRYVRNKKKDCEEIGINFEHVHIKNYEEMSQEDIVLILETLNSDFDVSGVIIQLPIPDKFNIDELQKCISPKKDVDGFRTDSCFKPCTPAGIMEWLKFNNYDFAGKDVVVIGRSKVVGKPLANMLIDEGATVTCCNSKSLVGYYIDNAELIISAVGKPKYFDCSTSWRNAKVIVDVGINLDEDGKLCGDINREEIEMYYDDVYITPVPNGVGLLTRLALIKNVVWAYMIQQEN